MFTEFCILKIALRKSLVTIMYNNLTSSPTVDFHNGPLNLLIGCIQQKINMDMLITN